MRLPMVKSSECLPDSPVCEDCARPRNAPHAETCPIVSRERRIRLASIEGRVKRLVVNRNNLGANRRDGGDRPVLSVQTSAGPIPCRRVHVSGPSDLVYNADKPLSCGATAWVETTAALVIYGAFDV